MKIDIDIEKLKELVENGRPLSSGLALGLVDYVERLRGGLDYLAKRVIEATGDSTEANYIKELAKSYRMGLRNDLH